MKNNLRNETSSIFERTSVPSPIPIRAGIIIALDMISKLLLKTPLSLREAQTKIATKSLVKAGLVNREKLKDEYLATRKAKGKRTSTDYDTSRRLSNLLRTLSEKPTPRSGREAMIKYSAQH